MFAAGLALGAIRVSLLLTCLDVKLAELVEMPVMLAVIWWSARLITRRFPLSPKVAARLGAGLLAFCLLAAAELKSALWLQGLAPGQYFARRDPVSGSVYLAMLVVFALMSLLLARHETSDRRSNSDRSHVS